MRQVAVFVDAGYLYAEGSTLLSGTRKTRAQIRLRVADVIAELAKLSGVASDGARLLRIYWYDGLQRGGRLSSEQSEIAHARDVKLRLGMVNGHGEQKGVDSLIVTDMIDLARNRAISDALILSGDEDVRVGVQVAQTFGVRVHLVGIEAPRGSQSPDLLREADTCRELNSETITAWMEILHPPAGPAPNEEIETELTGTTRDMSRVSAKVIAETITGLSSDDIKRAIEHMRETRDAIPPEIDRPTLARVGSLLGRSLDDGERRRLRRDLRAALERRAAAQ